MMSKQNFCFTVINKKNSLINALKVPSKQNTAWIICNSRDCLPHKTSPKHKFKTYYKKVIYSSDIEN